jgi:hypothetical protein
MPRSGIIWPILSFTVHRSLPALLLSACEKGGGEADGDKNEALDESVQPRSGLAG